MCIRDRGDGEYNSEVSGSNTVNYNDEITLNKNNDDVAENGVSKSDTVDNSENESKMCIRDSLYIGYLHIKYPTSNSTISHHQVLLY